VGNENYSTSLYWQAVGQPIIREAFAQGGFWTEIYDPDLAKEHWHAAGDELAIAHLLPGVVETGAVRPLAEWANSTSTAT